MNDKIKEILDIINYKYKDYYVQDILSGDDLKLLSDYITNLQEENERLKTKLNCKEYFSATIPEDTEFVILTKENYDRQQKDIQIELIDYKSRCEKAIRYINNIPKIICRLYDYDKHMRWYPGASYEKLKENVKKDGTLEGHFVEVNKDKILNILYGGDDK